MVAAFHVLTAHLRIRLWSFQRCKLLVGQLLNINCRLWRSAGRFSASWYVRFLRTASRMLPRDRTAPHLVT